MAEDTGGKRRYGDPVGDTPGKPKGKCFRRHDHDNNGNQNTKKILFNTDEHVSCV